MAIITATSHNGLQATCEVSVGIRTNAIDISVEGGGRAEVSLDESDLTLRATAIGPDGKPDTSVQDFEWRISNTSYATIRDNGDGTATITGRRTGYVKVAAIAKDGSGIREEISIRVIIPVEECWMEPVSNAGLSSAKRSSCWSTACQSTRPTSPPPTLPGRAAMRTSPRSTKTAW